MIARVKRVSEEEVRAVADRLKIQALSKEDLYQKAQVEGAADDQVYRQSMIGDDDTSGGSGELMIDDGGNEDGSPSAPKGLFSPADENQPDSGPIDTPDIDDEDSNSTDSPDELLARLFEANPDIDTPRAMQALKTAGVIITGQAVGRKLAAMRSGKNATIQPANESESGS